MISLKLNRYARKRQHKRELKRKHAIAFQKYDIGVDEDYCRRSHEEFEGSKYDDGRNGGYNYWNQFYLSGPRRYAKYCTNRKIRSMYRALLTNEILSEIVAPQGSDYEKLFDFWWTIY